MVYRIFVEKKKGFTYEADALFQDLTKLLLIKGLKGVRVLNRYDAQGIDKELFEKAIHTVFSEPQVDVVSEDIDISEDEKCFVSEFLPGQFDQRAESAAECIQIISRGKRPIVKSARVYVIEGDITDEDFEKIKHHVINPVESREAKGNIPESLEVAYDKPEKVEILRDFNSLSNEELQKFIDDNGLAMDIADLKFTQDYFQKENREPTITEIKVLDTYWSDHCRHTTFNTTIDSVKCEDEYISKAYDEYLEIKKEVRPDKPVSLMDIGTIAAKYLKKKGLLTKLDESDEINACTVKVDVKMNGKTEKWLLLFKNETHNHPTEIEPFGGAATCIGGAIRDTLSGRAYVYSAMRLTGAADPFSGTEDTLPGKLPQRTIITRAANGYSSYGNQIGLATGMVDELYHDGYVAKRMEIGAVVAATPAENVIRKQPEPGDVVILLGGKTGRDGIGGATGASKSHTKSSLTTCGAEVQKGNAPEERKIQRLFRNPECSRMIKRCNDFGAGGVSVAIGELAPGLDINLNKVPKKYEGLDGTEIAISESQERMAVVVAANDVEKFTKLANDENLEVNSVAVVTERPYLTIKWNNDTIVDIARSFIDTNGAEKHIDVVVKSEESIAKPKLSGNFTEKYKAVASDLNICSKRGLSEMFDSTIGAGTVLMPFGGKYQRTPIQAMVNLFSSEDKESGTCSVMSWGFNPFIAEKSRYKAGYLAVVESVSKLIATGAEYSDIYLSFQEYFEKLGKDPARWGRPFASVLGALTAQKGLKIAAIGGKDSMSGTFEDIDVPPTLVSFAITAEDPENIISPEFKVPNSQVCLLKPHIDEIGLPKIDSLKALFKSVNELNRTKNIISMYTPTYGGIAEAILKMCMGNKIGFNFDSNLDEDFLFDYNYGSFIIELDSVMVEEITKLRGFDIIHLGHTISDEKICYQDEKIELESIIETYEDKLEPIFKCNIKSKYETPKPITDKDSTSISANVAVAKPKVLIPVFPGTNCEYDSAKAFERAGANAEIFVMNNLSPEKLGYSIQAFADKTKESQILFIPGGFSGGDEPDGSGKFITAFFRNKSIAESVTDLLDKREGLIGGICNGFQALIKMGLLPYGKIMNEMSKNDPTLTFNEIGRHQSKLVRVRIASNKSPWLSKTKVGDIYTVPISHGEGRLIATDEDVDALAKNGQIATQYVNLQGDVTSDIQYNPNGSICAIEGITSPDGRVFGKMGHAERIGKNLYKNVPGDFDIQMFESAVEYFKG